MTRPYSYRDQIYRPGKKPRADRAIPADLVIALRAGELTRKEVARRAQVSVIAAWNALRGYTYKDLPNAQLERVNSVRSTGKAE